MNEAVASLLVVQDRDSKLVSLYNDLKRIPAEKQKISLHQEARSNEFQKAKKAVQETELAIRSLELDVEARRVSIGRLKGQQFETRKNDEYQAMGQEIVRYEKEVEELETHELELMEELEYRRETMGRAEEKLKQIRKSIEGELKTLEEKSANLTASIKEAEAERAKLAAKVEETLLARYERLKKSKGLPVLVLMSDSAQCGGCHTKIVRSTELQVREGKHITECENCGRILH